MKDLQLDYTTFEAIMASTNLPVYYADDGIKYTLVISARDFIYRCKAQSTEDRTAFETDYKATSIETGTEDNAVALATYTYKFSRSGFPILPVALYLDGKQLVIPSGQSSGYVEFTYDVDVDLQGGYGQVCGAGAQVGDYLDATVRHPYYGEVNRFCNHMYLEGTTFYTIQSEGISQMTAGLTVRMAYFAADTNGRTVNMTLRMYK